MATRQDWIRAARRGLEVIALLLGALVWSAASPGTAAGQAPQVVGTVTLEADPPLSIFSYQWDITVSPPGGGGSGGTPAFSDFKVTKAVDAVAPKLFAYVVTGRHLTHVQVDLTAPPEAGGAVLASYLLEDVVVTGDKLLGSPGGLSLEEVTFKGQGRITITATDPSGTRTSTCWDLATDSLC